jgi:hypothetical protein
MNCSPLRIWELNLIHRIHLLEVNPLLLYEKLLNETLEKNTSLSIASSNKTLSEFDYKLITSRSYPFLNLSTGYPDFDTTLAPVF